MSNLERNKYLLKNAGIFLIGNIGTKLINFLLVPLYTYALNTYEYGVVDLVGTLGFLLGPILMLNIHEGVLRFCIDKGTDTDAIMSIGYIALGSAMLLGLLVLPICNRIDILQNYSMYIYIYCNIWIQINVRLLFERNRALSIIFDKQYYIYTSNSNT